MCDLQYDCLYQLGVCPKSVLFSITTPWNVLEIQALESEPDFLIQNLLDWGRDICALTKPLDPRMGSSSNTALNEVPFILENISRCLALKPNLRNHGIGV